MRAKPKHSQQRSPKRRFLRHQRLATLCPALGWANATASKTLSGLLYKETALRGELGRRARSTGGGGGAHAAASIRESWIYAFLMSVRALMVQGSLSSRSSRPNSPSSLNWEKLALGKGARRRPTPRHRMHYIVYRALLQSRFLRRVCPGERVREGGFNAVHPCVAAKRLALRLALVCVCVCVYVCLCGGFHWRAFRVCIFFSCWVRCLTSAV